LAALLPLFALQSVKAKFVEGIACHHQNRFWYVAVASLLFINPVADIGVLERTALHGVEVDLTTKNSTYENSETETGT